MQKVIPKHCDKSPNGLHRIASEGICLIDYDSGFVQELGMCIWCLKKGQRPGMFAPSALVGMELTDDCIQMRSGKIINVHKQENY